MGVSTYSELQTAVIDRVDNTEVTTHVPDFVDLAEAHMKRELKTMRDEKRATASTVVDQEYLSLPTDYGGMISIYVQGHPKQPLTQVSLDKLRRAYGTNYTGKPVMFAVADEHLFFGPIPDSDYTVEMTYFGFAELSDSNTTNEILTHHPDAYFFLTLMYAYAHMNDDEREAKAMGQGLAVLEAIKNEDKWRKHGAHPLRAIPQASV